MANTRALVLLCMHFAPIHSMSFAFPDFCPWTGLRVVDGGVSPANSAIVNQGTKLRLVQANEVKKGIMSHSGEQNALFFDGGAGARVDMALPWTTTWSLAADKDGGGGAGLALIIASPADDFALGAIGSGVGYAGLDSVLAIEFDFVQDADTHDPDGNHVAVHASGAPPATVSADELAGPSPGVACTTADSTYAAKPWIAGAGAGIPTLSGKLYSATVAWAPGGVGGGADGTLTVSFPSVGDVLTCVVTLRMALGDIGGTEVAVGFVAANYAEDADDSGSGNISLHDWTLNMTGGGSTCFPGFDPTSDPPCMPVPPPDATCAAQSGLGCAMCVTRAQICGCEWCSSNGMCWVKGDGDCGVPVTSAYDACLALSPSASRAASPSRRATATAAPPAAAAGASGLSPGATAAASLGGIAALALVVGFSAGAAGHGPLAPLVASIAGAPATKLAAPGLDAMETSRLLAHGDRAKSALLRTTATD